MMRFPYCMHACVCLFLCTLVHEMASTWMLIYIDIDTLYFDYYNNSVSELHQINGDKVALVLILLNKKNIAMICISVSSKDSPCMNMWLRKKKLFMVANIRMCLWLRSSFFLRIYGNSRDTVWYTRISFFPSFPFFLFDTVHIKRRKEKK